jgi:hypothetical protein
LNTPAKVVGAVMRQSLNPDFVAFAGNMRDDKAHRSTSKDHRRDIRIQC